MDDHLIPLYLQAAKRIQQEIKSNNFREGEKLPRLNQLSRMMKMNTAAMEKGMQYLIDQEIIIKRSPLEYIINRGAKERILQTTKKEFFSKKVSAPLNEAEQLGISREEIVQYIMEKEGEQ